MDCLIIWPDIYLTFSEKLQTFLKKYSLRDAEHHPLCLTAAFSLGAIGWEYLPRQIVK